MAYIGGRRLVGGARLFLFLLLFLLLLRVRVFNTVHIFVLQPVELSSRLLGAWRRIGEISLPLHVEACGPLLHRFFIREFDYEVLDARVSLPPYLHRI